MGLRRFKQIDELLGELKKSIFAIESREIEGEDFLFVRTVDVLKAINDFGHDNPGLEDHSEPCMNCKERQGRSHLHSAIGLFDSTQLFLDASVPHDVYDDLYCIYFCDECYATLKKAYGGKKWPNKQAATFVQHYGDPEG